MKWARQRDPNSYFGRLTRLKKLFWLYFLLLVFEGALRKWVVPELTAPLLIIRDPVSIFIIWEAYRTSKWPSRWTFAITVATVLLTALFVLQSVFGGNPFLVGLYGLRSYLLPFPVIFIMAENLDEEDLRKLGVCTIWLLLLNGPLAVAQYLAPQGSFLNKGAYEGAEQISYYSGHLRASGTFSFAIGMVFFCTLAAVFILYGLVTDGFAKTWLLWAGTFALLVTVPTTGQRALVVLLAGVLVCVAIAAMMGASQFTKVLRVVIPILILSFLASLLPAFSNAMQSMTKRFQGGEGGTVEASIYERTVEPAVTAIEDSFSSDQWLGMGMGRGATAVSAFLSGSADAVAGEDEFSRDMVEMGPAAGFAYVFFKLLLAAVVIGAAMARARDHQPLALLCLPLVVELLLLGTPEQPTVGGFMVISTAFCIAAARLATPAPVPMLPLALQRQQMLYRRRMQRSGPPV
jgi:hypothetical protein